MSSIFQRGADTYYAYRFIRLLVTEWEDTEAYKLGVINSNGKRLKKPETSKEKAAYTYFHRLVFNIKRLLERVPAARNQIASFAAALYLIREHKNLSSNFEKTIIKKLELKSNDENINEWICSDGDFSLKGNYCFNKPITIISTGEEIDLRNKSLNIREELKPVTIINNIAVYEFFHNAINQNISFTINDIYK